MRRKVNSSMAVLLGVALDGIAHSFCDRQVIKTVELVTSILPGGPADKAGLKEEDRIVEINGENVERKSHSEIVKLIKRSMLENEISFKVIAEEDDTVPKPKQNGIAKKPTDFNPRVCKVKKKQGAFGFQLTTRGNSSGQIGHFIKSVVVGTSAFDSGLRKGDRVLRVGKKNIEKLNHSEVSAMVKKSGKKVTLLVIDDKAYKYYTSRNIPIKPKMEKKKSSIRSISSESHVSDTDLQVFEENSLPILSEDFTSASASRTQNSKLQAPVKSISQTKPTLATVPGSPNPTFSTFIPDPVAVKLVHVVKAKDGDLGFNIKRKAVGKKAHFVINGASGKSQMGRYKLSEGDHILAVNGEAIPFKSQNDIEEMIQNIPSHFVLLVLNATAVEKAKKQGITSTLEDTKDYFLVKPKRANLGKRGNGYGFCLKTEKVTNKHLLDDIDKNSSADLNGIKNNHVLLCIGDECVMHLNHNDCVKMILDTEGDLEITYGERSTVDLFYELEIVVAQELLDTWPDKSMIRIPDFSSMDDLYKEVEDSSSDSESEKEEKDVPESKTRLCHLTKVAGAFGFFLRDDIGHVLNQIEKGGSAERAGILENDLILEINGINVQKESHETVVQLIKDSGDEMNLLVIPFASEKADNLSISSSTSLIDLVEAEKPTEKEPHLSRHYQLIKTPDGYGFSLADTFESSNGSHVIIQVKIEGAAYNAGVREGDKLIEVNNVNVEEKSQQEVTKLIEESGLALGILVIKTSSAEDNDTATGKPLLLGAAAIEVNNGSGSHSSSISSSDSEDGLPVNLPPPLPPLVVPEGSSGISADEELQLEEEKIKEKEKQEEVLKEFDSLVEEMTDDLKESVDPLDKDINPAEEHGKEEGFKMVAEDGPARKSPYATVKKQIPANISESDDEDNRSGELVKIAALSALAAQISDEIEIEIESQPNNPNISDLEYHSESSSSSSSSDSDSENSEVKLEEAKEIPSILNPDFKSNQDIDDVVPSPPPFIPPPPPWLPPPPPISEVARQKKSNAPVEDRNRTNAALKADSSMQNGAVPFTPSMLSEIAKSLKPVKNGNERVEAKKTEIPEKKENGIKEKKENERFGKAVQNGVFKPSIVPNEVIILETPKQTDWIGNGMSLKIIETSSFDH